MSGLRRTYLVLAVLGAVWPMWHFIAHFRAGGTLAGLFEAWLANDAARGLSVDVLVTGTALAIWCVAETMLRRNWVALVTLPSIVLVGVSFAFPLYLFLRTRPID
ncbi:MAG: DUF2834 domain-containing protein [Alphaproteobacteria bacterium]|nr:MAG: DUF2834 domain-containing protein [Alphaproteobacteria bacterium]